MCESLQQENAGLTAHLIAQKEIQGVLLKDIENLKADRESLVQRKVHVLYIDEFIKLTLFLHRKGSTQTVQLCPIQ